MHRRLSIVFRKKAAVAFAAVMLVIILLLVMLAAKERTPHTAAESVARCPAATSFGMTFIQPLAGDANRTLSDWRRLFAQMRRMGVHEVVLQWTSIDDFDAYPRHAADAAQPSIVRTVVRAASAERMAVWIGLHSDTGFWSAADKAPAAIGDYFSQRLGDLENRLPALLAAMDVPGQAGSPVAGWYVSEEIDDTRWRDPERRALLGGYLDHARRLLAAARPGPVMISAFANGARAPEDYAADLLGLTDKAGYDALLFQDGVGAGKLSVEQAVTYLRALKNQAGRIRIVPIVELFAIAPDGAIQPAALPRILDQIDAEAPFASPTVAAFAIPHHMLAPKDPRAQLLLKGWRAMVRQCKRTQDQKDR